MSELPVVKVGSVGVSVTDGTPTCSVKVTLPLFACTLDDATLDSFSATETLDTFASVNVYGSRGFERLVKFNQTDLTRPFWKQCYNVCYCYGPVDLSQTLSLFERFETRWKFIYQNEAFYFGRLDESLTQVSTLLFPDPVADFDRFSVTFEQDNTQIFAVERAGEIELRRLQAGILTTLTFTGTSPVMFLNSTLQPDLGEQDVVCYYLNNGSLCGRWQRDNFAVEYVLIDEIDITDLRSIHANTEFVEPREYLFALKNCATRCLISSLYPVWAYENTNIGAGILSGYTEFAIVALPPESDLCGTYSAGVLAGLSESVIIVLPLEADTLTSYSTSILSGLSELVIVAAAPETDTLTNYSFSLGSGVSELVIILGGSYSESVSHNTTFLTGLSEYE